MTHTDSMSAYNPLSYDDHLGHKRHLEVINLAVGYISRYMWKRYFDVTFLPGALSPVTASNGGAGGVFLDGTGGYFEFLGIVQYTLI